MPPTTSAGAVVSSVRSAAKRCGVTMALAKPVSSSSVMKKKPLAVPGRWRTITVPAASMRVPSGTSARSTARRMPRARKSGRSSDTGCGPMLMLLPAKSAAMRSFIDISPSGMRLARVGHAAEERVAAASERRGLPQRAPPRERPVGDGVERAYRRQRRHLRRIGAAAPRHVGHRRERPLGARAHDGLPHRLLQPRHVAQAEAQRALLERAQPVGARDVDRPQLHAAPLASVMSDAGW